MQHIHSIITIHSIWIIWLDTPEISCLWDISCDISCFCRHCYPHHPRLQPWLSSYVQLVSPPLQTVCRLDAVSKLYISDTIEIRIMIFPGMKGLDVDHLWWVLQCCSLIFLKVIVVSLFPNADQLKVCYIYYKCLKLRTCHYSLKDSWRNFKFVDC